MSSTAEFRCTPSHRLWTELGRIGPDRTGSDREKSNRIGPDRDGSHPDTYACGGGRVTPSGLCRRLQRDAPPSHPADSTCSALLISRSVRLGGRFARAFFFATSPMSAAISGSCRAGSPLASESNPIRLRTGKPRGKSCSGRDPVEMANAPRGQAAGGARLGEEGLARLRGVAHQLGPDDGQLQLGNAQRLRPAPHRTAPHRIASQHIALHRIASDRIASDLIGSDRIASDRKQAAAWECPAPAPRPAPHRTAPHRLASHRTAPHRI